jgi:acyl carrier protein phosphodiesterase
MNFLGHACLSFGEKEILVGNILSDYIKGRSQYDYPLQIQKGIRLHRAIDAFTDTNAAVKEMSSFFKPAYRLYAFAIIDVVLDYFIANDDKEFATEPDLLHFTASVYKTLDEFKIYFPTGFAGMFPYMQNQDWLYHYRFESGIKKSMEGLRRRALNISEMDTAFRIFQDNIPTFKILYDDFYPSVKKFAAGKMQDLLKP